MTGSARFTAAKANADGEAGAHAGAHADTNADTHAHTHAHTHSDADASAQHHDAAEREREAADRLWRVNGALELQAAVLALLLPPGSRRAARAWEIETEGVANAAALRTWVGDLRGPARLPWFETLVSRLRGQPLEARQNLLEATRRVMGARGTVRPIDRLHWLAMRQRLSSPAGSGARTATAADLSRLPQADVSAIAMYSAFLSRTVPVDAATDPAAGIAWYATVMQPWQARAVIPPCQPPDSDGLVHALQELQALPWMQRPMLVRGWVAAALQHRGAPGDGRVDDGGNGRVDGGDGRFDSGGARRSDDSAARGVHGGGARRFGDRGGPRFDDGAADALRLSCALLDSPLPPELARHHTATMPGATR